MNCLLMLGFIYCLFTQKKYPVLFTGLDQKCEYSFLVEVTFTKDDRF